MTDPDPLLEALAALDPSAGDTPPAPGSHRTRMILETAMSEREHEHEPEPEPEHEPETDTEIDLHSPRRRRTVALVAAGVAAAVVAFAAVSVVGSSGGRVEPAAALTQAAETTGDVESLRIRATYVDPGGTRILEAEVDGRDYHLRSRNAPGHDDEEPGSNGEEWTIGIGDQQWSDEDLEPITMPDELRNEPFPVASKAVLRAALRGATITDEGDEDIDGVRARHYRIDLGERGVAALAGLPANQTAMFELEYPQGVTSLEVWVADDLIRRLVVTTEESGSESSATLDYYDFGADIVIEPPS